MRAPLLNKPYVRWRKVSVTLTAMKIGELAKRAGVSHRTIHYYENRGLLSAMERHEASHRLYEEEALYRLEKIAALKRLGLSLEDIGEVIDLYFDGVNQIKGKKKVIEILQGHLVNVETQLQELAQFRQDLQQNIAHMETRLKEAEEASATSETS